MTSLEEIQRKIKFLINENYSLNNNELDNLRKNNKEFMRSLEVMEKVDEIYLSKLGEIEKLVLFFKEIVGIEILIRYNEKSPRHEFSLRMAWLLGTTEKQLEAIQEQLGTLYAIRSYIVHSLELPKNDKNFKRYFDSDISKAIIIANKYHRLALLRYFERRNKIISKKTVVKNLKKIELKLYLNIPKSYYKIKISKEIEKLTGIKSRDDELRISLPNENQCFYWGINTYGGLVLPTHKITGNEELFYNGGTPIIPEISVWKNLISNIKKQIKSLQEKQFKKIRLISKTHHSVLFYVGYRLYRTNDYIVTIDFDGENTTIRPFTDKSEFNAFWRIEQSKLKKKARELVLILNVTSWITEKVEENLTRLNLNKLPKLILCCKCGKTKTDPPNSLCFTSSEQIKQTCRALDIYLTQNEKLRSIEKIHLFSESRGVMMLLLGVHLGLQKKEVILYEYGKREPLNEERKYYKVIECR
ncbi:MAG: SAVED domain-containing protein [Candidatus Heimdallarchaeaceae archaeon]